MDTVAFYIELFSKFNSPKGVLLFLEVELGLHFNSRGKFKVGSFYCHGS